MKQLFRLNKQSQAWFVECECVLLASDFCPWMKRGIMPVADLTEVMWMLVPISAGVDYATASIIFIFIIHFRLYFWNLETLSTLTREPLRQNIAQRPLSPLWRRCFLSKLWSLRANRLITQHFLKSEIVNLAKLDFAEHGCHKTLRAVNKKVRVQMVNLGKSFSFTAALCLHLCSQNCSGFSGCNLLHCSIPQRLQLTSSSHSGDCLRLTKWFMRVCGRFSAVKMHVILG